jgi:hypothetical protein
VVDILPHHELAEFVKKYASNVEEISLLLITSSLRYERVEDLSEKCELHFEHLLAKYPHKLKSRTKYDQLLRHFNILILDIRNLIRERDFQLASVLYIEVLKSLFPTFYQIANTDLRFKNEVESFEQHITLFNFSEISPSLKEKIKQGIAFVMNQDWYPGSHSDGGFYLLDQVYLPTKHQIKTHLERIIQLDPKRFYYPVLAMIARFNGLPLSELSYHWKIEEWLVCLNMAEKFPNKREPNSILFDMIDRFIIKDFKEEAYIIYFQRYDKAPLKLELLKPMVRFSNANRSSRLISIIPRTFREPFLTCLKSELKSFTDYTYYAELAKIWEMNSNIQDLIDWDNPISFFGLAGGLSDVYITKHKAEIFSAITYFLTHFFGEQNKAIFREFMSNMKSVSEPLFYDDLVNYIRLEFEGRADILKPMDLTGLRVEYFKQ